MREGTTIAFTGKNQLEVIQEQIGDPGEGQVLIETTKSLISTGTELICFSRNFEPGSHWDQWVSSYPFHPGYSNVGRVVEVGEGVQSFKPGDRVASWSVHRQYFLRDVKDCYSIPDDVSDEEATWFALAIITQIGVRVAEHKLGDTVAIIGAGLLGQLVTQYTRLFGAKEVIVMDTAPKRLEMVKAGSATITLAMTAADALPEIERLTNGKLADVVYDITGHAPVFSDALKLARNFGTVVLLGDTGKPTEQHLTLDVLRRGLKIVGTHASHAPEAANEFVLWSRPRMAELFFHYVKRGDMNVKNLITHRFKPQQASEAYEMLLNRREDAMGVIFDWTD